MKKIKNNYACEERKEAISLLVFHCFALSTKKMLAVFQKTGTSCHYIIQRNGRVYSLVNENQVAYHAGLASWQTLNEKLNQHSIGIELQNPKLGEIQYTKAQIQSLIKLSKKIIKKYHIKPENIVGHSDIAPFRKPDPGRCFPWQELGKKGIGLWPTKKTKQKEKPIETQIKKYLQQIGYNTLDLTATLYAFCKRFIPNKVPALSNVIQREAKVFQYWIQKPKTDISVYMKKAPVLYPKVLSKLKSDPDVLSTLQQVAKLYSKKDKIKKYIIGNMTGNSMDAIDLVLTEFQGDKMRDICSYSKPYSKQMQDKMEHLRTLVKNKTKAQILRLSEFQSIHDEYVHQVADCINQMCQKFKLDKASIDAIGFHGKTLDHNPPSKAKANQTNPYTLQIGSGQMLSNLTQIPVVYDFRSAPLMAGFEGAPLVPPHNAHIATTEGDGCYYNGGNTSNFAWIINGKAQLGADAGPCNEYVDNFIRQNTPDSFDQDGKYGLLGKLNPEFLKKLFDLGRPYYERNPPKSDDPQYYQKEKVFQLIKKLKIPFHEAVHTLEYFSAYIAFQGLTLTPKKIQVVPQIILFGGGWKNPVIRQSFEDLLQGKGFVLPEHQKQFQAFLKRFQSPIHVKYSSFGQMMEARLFADLARYKLENKAWEIPEIVQAKKSIICGVYVKPNHQTTYTDQINLAAKGWQERIKK